MSRLINSSQNESTDLIDNTSKRQSVMADDGVRGSRMSGGQSEDGPKRAYENKSAEKILGNTMSSHFGSKKKKKSFAN